ncbi:MAG: heavy-metal-associated domain-containing protein [Gemmatimonadaceae bacterium]|nr:heavy-metal-associated domain-containing protein [Acetobacteraceae bacterium]
MTQMFKVSGMSCAHCVSAVTAAIHGVDPGAGVEVDLALGMVTVTSQAEGSMIAAAIGAAGYDTHHLAA